MKKILPLLLLTLMGTQAQVLDAIAIDVEGEPITTLEIQAVQQKMSMSKQAAVEALIKDRLEISALKKANINIDPSAVQARAQAIASSKGISQDQMRNILLQKGLTWDSYIAQLTNEMKKERFYKQEIASTITPPSDADLEMYYNAHQAQFANAPTQISLIAYSSPSEQALKEAIQNSNQNLPNVRKKNLLLNSSEMTPQLRTLIDGTAEGQYSQMVNVGPTFISYYVKSKGATGQSGFQAVRQAVLQRWIQDHRVQAGQDFFNKLKSNAKIRVIRL